MKTITLKSKTNSVPVPLSDLNKSNSKFLSSIENQGWLEATKASMEVKSMTTEYRNRLLASLAGKTVTVKGYLIDKTSPTNYTIAFASIYFDGCLVDTLHHVNVYVDILSNSPSLHIGGFDVEGKGNYSVVELTKTLMNHKLNNDSFLNCQQVVVEGISYSYKGKWSVGTERQVNYATEYN
jgi:hypothetical protein